MIKSKLSLLAFVLATISSQAFAGSVTANFQTNAILSSSCVISATDISFGAITPAATGNAQANGTITSTCSKNVNYSLSINSGNSGNILSRSMSGSVGNTDVLSYNLYTTNAGSTVWGNGTTGSAFSLTGTGSAFSLTVYGRIPLNQYLKPDNYSDNLTATISY